ncbi:MAG: hypothetical protein ACI83O_000358 [Patescibacteria group bacterium]|jgi:hypothetical protein
MNTQSHAIMNLAIMRKFFTNADSIKHFNSLVVLGSILPDVPMFIFFIYYAFIVGAPQQQIWNELYFTPSWHVFFDLFNSIPIFLIICLLAYYYQKRGLLAFGLANLLHFAGDFFVHQIDGHAHFYPFTMWKFISPVSYWDPAHHGVLFSLFETALVIACSVYLFRFIKKRWSRVALVLVNVLNITNYLIWYVVFNVF